MPLKIIPMSKFLFVALLAIGGLRAQETIDHSKAQTTIPFRESPIFTGTCQPGEFFIHTSELPWAMYRCDEQNANKWIFAGPVSNTSGAPTNPCPGPGYNIDTTNSNSYFCPRAGGTWQLQSGSGMSNPMTGVGDLIVGGAGGTPTRFAGNTSGTKYLSENASGIISWQPVASGGATIPSVTTVLKGDGAGNAADTKVTFTSPATAATVQFAADNETVVLPNGTLAYTGVDINTSGQVTATHLASPLVETQGGTGANNNPATAGHYLRANGTHYVDSAIQAGDLPNPGASSKGGVQSIDCSAGGQFIQKINTDATETCATPAGGGNVSTSGLTLNKVPKAASGTSLGDSSLSDNGTTVSTTEPISAPSVQTGSSPPSVTAGTGGVWAAEEGTAPSAGFPSTSVDGIYADSTAHGLKASFNNDTARVLARQGNDINSSDQVTQMHDKLTSVNNAASPYTVVATDTYIACDASSGAVTINLPAATGTGREISVKKTDSSSNACTPTRNGTDTIDGATSYSLTVQYASSKVVDQVSGAWGRSHVNQLGGDLSGVSTNATVSKVNGNTPGGTCTNQFVRSLSSSAIPTCASIAQGDVPANLNFNVDSSLGTSVGTGLYVPGASLTAGDIYYVGASGLALAEANASTTLPGVCLAISTTACVFSGVYRFGSSQSWTQGQIVYVSDSSAGALVTTAPSTSGHYVQRVGIALAADTLLIMPSIDVGTIQ